MNESVGDVIAQMRVVLNQLDSAAVTATRAQEDAKQASAHYCEASQGTNHPRIHQAVAESRTAGEKAGKVARLLAQAAEHFSAYLNDIAPGSVPSRQADTTALPSGERITDEAADRGSKLDRFIRRQVKKLDDAEEKLQKAESTASTAYKELLKSHRGSPGSTGTSTKVEPQPLPTDRPQADYPATAAIILAGAAAVFVRRLWSRRRSKH